MMAKSIKEEEKSNEPLIVDVRTRGEFAGGAYPGAVNIPLDEIVSRAEELGAKDRKIILYCASGGRSSYAVQILSKMGFTNLENGGGLMHMMMRKKWTEVAKNGEMDMQKNIGRLDKIIRILVGLAVVGAGLYFKSMFGLIGIIPIITAVIEWCPLYILFGINSFKK